MRHLYLTTRSPYARKVWLTLLHKGLPVELCVEDLGARSAGFVAASPIGKVPVLVDDDGTTVCDSTVICEYLEDRYPDPPTSLPGWQGRLAVRELDELGDSLSDQAIAAFFARQAGDEAAAERALRRAQRLLEALEHRVPEAAGEPLLGRWTWADGAVHSALGYTTLRLGPGWRAEHPRLAAWADRMDETPAGALTIPRV